MNKACASVAKFPKPKTRVHSTWLKIATKDNTLVVLNKYWQCVLLCLVLTDINNVCTGLTGLEIHVQNDAYIYWLIILT